MSKIDTEVEVGSGNVFADLGIPEPEVALAKAKLATEIGDAIKARGLTQVQAAMALGMPQPKISMLTRGQLRGFSLERLIRCLRDLQRKVEIVVSDSPRPLTTGHVNVVVARTVASGGER